MYKLKDNIKFIRKDKTLFRNEWRTVKETPDGFVYDEGVKGVTVIPYRYGKNELEILVRKEANPLHENYITLITGRKDDKDSGIDWYYKTTERELEEEAGLIPTNGFINQGNPTYLGEMIQAKDVRSKDKIVAVNCTEFKQIKPETDNTKWEKESKNFWLPASVLKYYIRSRNEIDSTMYSALLRFSSQFDILKSEEIEEFEKQMKGGPSKLKGKEKPGHKYIRREAKGAGEYKYIYQEPKGKKGEKKDEGKPKGPLAQLVELLSKKGQGEGEKAPPKPKPLEEFARFKGVKDFVKDMSAAQFISRIESDMFSAATLNIDVSGGVLPADSALKALKNQPSKMEFDKDSIKISNKKLSPDAQYAVKNSFADVVASLSLVEYTTNIMNGSTIELVPADLAERLEKADSDQDLSADVFSDMRKFSSIIGALKDNLEIADSGMRSAIGWLANEDEGLDFVSSQVFESVDKLMAARNRFVEKSLKFFVAALESRIENLNDSYAIDSTLKILKHFNGFISSAIASSTTSRQSLFANQWNQKQRGIYDAASRLSSVVTKRIVDKYKNIVEMEGDVARRYTISLMGNESFDFLTMRGIDTPFTPFSIGEQMFSFIETHGRKAFTETAITMLAQRKTLYKESKDIESISAAMEVLEKAYQGRDVYMDDDVLYYSSEIFDQKIGSMSGIAGSKTIVPTTLYQAMNTLLLTNKETPESSIVPAFISMWSIASHASTMTNAIETFVDAKKIDRGSFVNYHIASNRAISNRRKEVKEGLASSIDKVYRTTQLELSDAENETISLYRGNGTQEVKSVASSWTLIDDIASNFGPTVTKANVPKDAILVHRSEINDEYWIYPHENEYVVVPGILPPDRRFSVE